MAASSKVRAIQTPADAEPAGIVARVNPQVLRAVGLILGVSAAGVLYFHFRMGLGWVEAFYNVIITLSTVGYERPRPDVLTTENMMFIALLIPLGVGTTAYAASLMVSNIVEGQLGNFLEARKMKKQIHTLRGHVIVCGLGGIGRLAARELRRAGREVVCVDRDPEVLEELRNEGYLAIEGDATEEPVLENAGIHHAEVLIAAMSNEAEAVFLTLTSRFLNGRLRIVARGADETSERKLRRAGANVVIMPAIIGGRRMAQSIIQPNVLDFVDLTTGRGEHALRLDELKLAKTCDFAGLTLEKSNLRQRYGVIIVAVRKADGVMRFNPSSEMVCEAGDIIVALGEANSLDRLKEDAT